MLLVLFSRKSKDSVSLDGIRKVLLSVKCTDMLCFMLDTALLKDASTNISMETDDKYTRCHINLMNKSHFKTCRLFQFPEVPIFIR